MPRLIILGTSNAVPGPEHENTHMVLVGDERTLLIDCVDSMVVRLGGLGLDHESISDLLLTHIHPDHVAGVPSFLMSMWLMGRKRPLTVYGLASTLERMEKILDQYQWRAWPDFFKVTFQEVPPAARYPLLISNEFCVYSSPVQHMVPTLGLRINFSAAGKSVAYSCDTQPCQAVVDLAAGADILIHEATGEEYGHSSAAQAGEIARQAEVGQLLLIHYPTNHFDYSSLPAQASAVFGGPAALATDLMELAF